MQTLVLYDGSGVWEFITTIEKYESTNVDADRLADSMQYMICAIRKSRNTRIKSTHYFCGIGFNRTDDAETLTLCIVYPHLCPQRRIPETDSPAVPGY
jgi:hypothetical protein